MEGNRLKNGLECNILRFDRLIVQITLTVFLISTQCRFKCQGTRIEQDHQIQRWSRGHQKNNRRYAATKVQPYWHLIFDIRCLIIWTFEHLNIWTLEHWNIGTLEHRDKPDFVMNPINPLEHLKIWRFDHLKIWTFEHLNLESKLTSWLTQPEGTPALENKFKYIAFLKKKKKKGRWTKVSYEKYKPNHSQIHKKVAYWMLRCFHSKHIESAAKMFQSESGLNCMRNTNLIIHKSI